MQALKAEVASSGGEVLVGKMEFLDEGDDARAIAAFQLQRDGCNPLQTLWLISIPLAAPALATTLIFCFIFSWNEFLLAFILTRANAKTVPLTILEGIGMWDIRWEYMSAMAVIAMIPPLVLAFLARRHLAKGLTLGAIK